jgi:PTS system nitrogen regulatory IIA component
MNDGRFASWVIVPGASMKIADFFHDVDIIPELTATSREGVLGELAEVLASHHGLDAETLLKVLLEREKLGSTGIGDGIAIPHGKLREVQDFLLAFGRSSQGVEFNALDGKPVYLVFLLIAPENSIGVHLKMLARVSRILKNATLRKRLLQTGDAALLHAMILEQDSRH